MTNDNPRSGTSARGGPGQGPGGKGGRPGGPGAGAGRGGFGDARRGGGPGGRGGGREGRGGGRDRKDRREGGGERGGAYRIPGELSALEKALSTGDFAKQRAPLDELVKILRPLHLKSVEELDLGTRGKLITTLSRVARQPKPPGAPDAPAEAAPAEGASASESPAAEAPAAEAAAEAAPEAPAEAAPEAAVEAAPEAAAEPAPAEAAAAPAEGEAKAPEAPKKSPEQEKAEGYADVMYRVGCVWRAAGDDRRAALAFAASGRKEQQREAVKTLQKTGDWREEATVLEQGKRTRDAAKVHERHKSHEEAARLYEAGGDLKSALKSFIAGKDLEAARRLLKLMKPAESGPVLEKAGAYELLMEHYVAAGQFEDVARLYERARQFDQAALAWERAGKLSQARKAFERAKDTSGVARVRALEIAKLIERGDRLGAALLHLAAGAREKAVETLTALPAPKAFRFLQKAKLDAEALALAKKELEVAEKSGQHPHRARWLELLGEPTAAAQAWEQADRKDRALPLYEQAADWAKAAQLAEALGQYPKAIELYQRTGDKAAAERVAALPPPAVTTPSAPTEAEAAELSDSPPATAATEQEH